jgi:outer membrane lipoprotein-sorting protein
MSRKILAIFLVLVMALTFVACDGGEELPTAQEIVDNTTQALDNIRTYQFEMTMNMDVSGESAGEAFEGTVASDYDGALDLESRKMKIAVTMNVAMTGEDTTDMATETYFVDDMMYMMTEPSDTGTTWMKTAIPAGYWEQMNQVESQIEILGTAQVEVAGSEKVGGVDCYVLEVTLDLDQLWQLFTQQMGMLSDIMPDISPEILNEMFQDYSAKQWISKDAYFIMKVEVEMTMEVTPELMGSPGEEGEAAMDIFMTLLAYDYNQPVSIELPPGAEDAIEMSMPGL